MTNISDTTENLGQVERLTIDLSEMAEKPSGAWPKGWYASEVIEGYAVSGHTFTTGNTLSRKQDSFNFRLCFRVTSGTDVRTMFTSINYRSIDFTPERMTTVANLRKEFAGQKGKWPGYEDEQRSSLALGQIGQLQKATGVMISLDENGAIVASSFIGKKPFIRLTIDDETGYNEINGFSAYANGVEPKQKKS